LFRSLQAQESESREQNDDATTILTITAFQIRGLVTWYVKLRLEQRRGGKTVLLASLHGAERDFDERRTGGPLRVEFKLREL
jgi:hypothetical protein